MRRSLRLFQRSSNGGASALTDSIRADARRNRERLLEAAAAAFGAADRRPVSLESIARDAGVGIGTLYRHFPSRDVLVDAVYRAELAEVAAAAGRLLQRHPPKAALRRWMDRYASFVAAKRGMAESLAAMLDSGAVAPSQTRASIVGAVEMLLQAGAEDGSLRCDVRADDVVSSLLAQCAQPTARPAPAQNCARTAFLSGLPSPVSGSASTTTTRLGDCTEPLRSLTAAWISAVMASIAASSRAASARSTTTAVTASPHFSSGVPTTHTCAIAACSATTSSTSRGNTLKPPVTIMSLTRSTM